MRDPDTEQTNDETCDRRAHPVRHLTAAPAVLYPPDHKDQRQHEQRTSDPNGAEHRQFPMAAQGKLRKVKHVVGAVDRATHDNRRGGGDDHGCEYAHGVVTNDDFEREQDAGDRRVEGRCDRSSGAATEQSE